MGPFRAELDEQRIELLEIVALAGARLEDGALLEAERAARRAVEASPFRESARLALLEVLRRRGNVAEALVAYEEFRTFLRDELGSTPGRELLALHEALLRSEPAVPAAAPASRAARSGRLPDRLEQAVAAPWVGRAAELARLRKEADVAVAGRSGLILVAGEGGIGKTRLVAELAAGLDGVRVLYGRCDEEEIFPFGPWVDLLRPPLERMDDAELANLLGADAARLARLLPELRERLPAGAVEPAGDPETERRLLFDAVTRVVRRLALHEPLLLVLDDLHWADRSSLLLGRHLARQPRLGPVLLVGTFRETELEPGHALPELIADVERDRPVPRVQLGGMDEQEVAALIGRPELTGDAVRSIRDETDGNPFFVKQLVRHLAESGAEAGVPQGVRAVIARRVARLPAEAGRVLRVAALIGRDFEFDVLARVAGLPEGELLDILDAAVRGALLAEVPSTPGRYSFAHALLRSTMEAELSATRRALLHRRIGEAIEQRHRDRLDPWLGELARHFAAAGPAEVDRAVDYAARAAQQATERLAYDEAVGLLERAVALRRADDPVDEAELARLMLALASAQADAGRWEAARAGFARAASAARAADAGATFARAALGHPGSTWEHYNTEDAASIALLEEALERLPEGDSSLRAQVLARLPVHLHFVVDVPEERVLETADAAVAMARRLGDADALVAALTAAQHARWRPGRAADRLPIAAELIELAEARGAPVAAAEAHLWRAVALIELCRLDEADVHLARYVEVAEETQQYALLVNRDALRAMRALLEGDFERGEEAAQAVIAWEEHEEAHGRSPTPFHAQCHAAAMLPLLNERDELGRLTPVLERLVDQVVWPGWRPALAWAHAQAGRPELGRAEIEAMSADGFAAVPRDSSFLTRLAQVAHAIGELGDVQLAARLEPLLAPFGAFWVVFGPGAATLGPVAYSVGLLRLLEDRAEEAIAAFEQALERSERMRARPYVARSRAGLAEALRRRAGPGDAARAEELSALAAADARALGMSRLLRELGLSAS